MTVHADFASQEYFRNPAAEIEKLRAAGPVAEVRFPLVGRVWTTTTQDLANQVLRDSQTFTLRKERRRRRRILLVDAENRAHDLQQTCCRPTSRTTPA